MKADSFSSKRVALFGLGGSGRATARALAEAGADLCAGRLVDVVPGWEPRAGLIHAVYPSRRGQLPSVRALLDFLDGALDEEDAPLPRA